MLETVNPELKQQKDHGRDHSDEQSKCGWSEENKIKLQKEMERLAESLDELKRLENATKKYKNIIVQTKKVLESSN